MIAAFGTRRRPTCRGRRSARTGWPIGSGPPRSSPTTARCSPLGSNCFGPPCRRRCNLSYAVKANPMPAVVQHLAGLVDSFDVASALEMRTALDTPMPRGPASASPGPARPRRRSSRPSRRASRSRWNRRRRPSRVVASRRRAGCAPAGRGPGESRLPGQGLRHAHGRRAAAVRRGCRTGA